MPTIPATLPLVSHPSLGRPPLDLTAGFPDAADRLRTSRGRIAARALDIALADRKGMRDRYDELGLRKLLRDAELLVDRLALSVAANDPSCMREYAVWTDIVYRRRRVPMDDLVALCEGIRTASASVLSTAACRSVGSGSRRHPRTPVQIVVIGKPTASLRARYSAS